MNPNANVQPAEPSSPWKDFRSKITDVNPTVLGEAVVVDKGVGYFADSMPAYLMRGQFDTPEEYSEQVSRLVNKNSQFSVAYRLKSDALPAPHQVPIMVESLQRKGIAVKPVGVGDTVQLICWRSERGSVIFGFRNK